MAALAQLLETGVTRTLLNRTASLIRPPLPAHAHCSAWASRRADCTHAAPPLASRITHSFPPRPAVPFPPGLSPQPPPVPPVQAAAAVEGTHSGQLRRRHWLGGLRAEPATPGVERGHPGGTDGGRGEAGRRAAVRIAAGDAASRCSWRIAGQADVCRGTPVTPVAARGARRRACRRARCAWIRTRGRQPSWDRFSTCQFLS
jgi:hypothetical protein